VLANSLPDHTTADAQQNRFLQFLEFLGDKVKLHGWQKYRGELDVQENLHGDHSIYAEFDERCVMFQVLPWFRDTGRRWPKAGNDLVLLIYQESGQFVAPLLPSQLVHAYLVVQPVPQSSPPKFR
jgi:Rap/ran-GAP